MLILANVLNAASNTWTLVYSTVPLLLHCLARRVGLSMSIYHLNTGMSAFHPVLGILHKSWKVPDCQLWNKTLSKIVRNPSYNCFTCYSENSYRKWTSRPRWASSCPVGRDIWWRECFVQISLVPPWMLYYAVPRTPVSNNFIKFSQRQEKKQCRDITRKTSDVFYNSAQNLELNFAENLGK